MTNEQKKLMDEYKAECREIALECREEGYPDHGSNYELRCEQLWRDFYAEYFEEDPFEWKCGGCALIVSDEVRTDHILEELNSHDIYAEVIGNVTEGKEKKLMIKDDVRFLNRV